MTNAPWKLMGNTESKIIAEKHPAFRGLVAESMNYTAYANLKSVAG